MKNIVPKTIINKGINPMIYLSANEFYQTAENIQERFHTRALIVNYAFSIELYLKSLTSVVTLKLKENKSYPEYDRTIETSRGHNLLNLYNKLKEVDRKKISDIYLEKYNSRIQEHLSDIKADFIDYRYSYENDMLSTNLSALKWISLTLKEYIESEMKN